MGNCLRDLFLFFLIRSTGTSTTEFRMCGCTKKQKKLDGMILVECFVWVWFYAVLDWIWFTLVWSDLMMFNLMRFLYQSQKKIVSSFSPSGASSRNFWAGVDGHGHHGSSRVDGAGFRDCVELHRCSTKHVYILYYIIYIYIYIDQTTCWGQILFSFQILDTRFGNIYEILMIFHALS